MPDFKKKYKTCLQSLLFFVILAGIFFTISVKTEGVLLENDRLVPIRNKNIYRIQREPANSIDVIVLGDSLSYSAVSPMVLWREHGFTSYVCGQSGQKIQETENMLKTVLENQSPKLVILETDVMFRGGTGMKSFNEAIEEVLNYYIPVFRGHDSWKSLVMDKEYEEKNYKGFAFRCTIQPYEKGNYMQKTEQKEEISNTILTHMDTIMNLCAEYGADLLLVATPSPLNYNYARHNSLSAYAKEHDLSFLDLNLMLDKVGINWKTDTRDKGDHLNLLGAEKVSKYLGEYLAGEYDLPDHRGKIRFRDWTNEAAVYTHNAERHMKDMGKVL